MSEISRRGLAESAATDRRRGADAHAVCLHPHTVQVGLGRERGDSGEGGQKQISRWDAAEGGLG